MIEEAENSYLDVLLKDEKVREDLARDLVQEVDPSIEAKGELPELWKKNESIQRNEKGCSGQQDIAPNYKPFHVPLVQPRVDIIAGSLYQRFTSVDPMVQCVPYGDTSLDQASAMERLLQTVFMRAGLDTQLPLGVQTACTCGIVVFRVSPNDETKELRMEAIHPNDFVVYPSTEPSIKKAKTCGHRYWVRAALLQGESEWPVKLVTGRFPEESERSGSPLMSRTQHDSGVTLDEDMPVECWELFTRRDVGEGVKLYKARITRDIPRLLSFEEVSFKRPWYFEGRLHVEWGGFWPQGSIAQNAQGMQHLYTDLHNALVAGSYAAMSPKVVLSGGTLTEKFFKMGFNDVYQSASPITCTVIPSSFNPGVLPQMIQEVDAKADAIMRVSRISQNRQLKGRTTASEAEMLQNQGDDSELQYAAHFSRTLTEISEFICSFLQEHPAMVEEVYPEHKEDFPALVGKYRYEVTGRTQSNLPSTQVDKFSFALQTAMTVNATVTGADVGVPTGKPPVYDVAVIADALLEASQLPISVEKMKYGPVGSGAEPPEMAGTMGLPGMDDGGQVPQEAAGASNGLAAAGGPVRQAY